jgi:hypothetical protein
MAQKKDAQAKTQRTTTKVISMILFCSMSDSCWEQSDFITIRLSNIGKVEEFSKARQIFLKFVGAKKFS